MAVGMRHQLVRLLGGRVQAYRMVGVVVHAERQLSIRTVHARRACVYQMPAAMVPACLQYVEESGDVAFDVGVGILERIAHTGLRGEMDHAVEALVREQLRYG